MSSHVDATLVQEALHMALGRRQPTAGLRQHAVACVSGGGQSQG
jgi:hypothetical protein